MTLTEAIAELRWAGNWEHPVLGTLATEIADMLEAMVKELRNAEIDRDTYHAALKAIHNECHNEWRQPFEILAAIARITDQVVVKGAK